MGVAREAFSLATGWRAGFAWNWCLGEVWCIRYQDLRLRAHTTGL